jgi:hypothetical protein
MYQIGRRIINGIRYIKIHAVELLVPDPSLLEAEIAIAQLKRYKLLSGDQI